MAILLNNNGYGNEHWQKHLQQQLPSMSLQLYPKISDVESVHYALVWNHPKRDLLNYPNLRAVFSLGAGMEHLLLDDNLPNVPLVPLLDPVVAEDMANYGLYWVTHFHRRFADYKQQQNQEIWQRLEIKLISEFKVTILGLGRIAQKLAETIQYAGYQVEAWDFKTKDFPPEPMNKIKTHAGIGQLYNAIRDRDVVINCLPMNDKTKGLINADFLSQLSTQTSLVNISRGGVVDESDLLDSLNHDAIKHAVLDVVNLEPLTANHPFWNHPKVTITPHISGSTYASSGAKVIVKNILLMENGEMPEGIYDMQRHLR